MSNEHLALYVVAIAALMLATVALSVFACEWRHRKRQAVEAAAVRRGAENYTRTQKEKIDLYIQSLSPALQEKWARDLEALNVRCDLYASASNTGHAQHIPGVPVSRTQIP